MKMSDADYVKCIECCEESDVLNNEMSAAFIIMCLSCYTSLKYRDY